MSTSADVRAAVEQMRAISLRALDRMYLPAQELFCFCIRRGPAGDEPEGVSRRYTAIVLIGLATEDAAAVRSILGDAGAAAPFRRLLGDLHAAENLGDVALTLWAATLWKHTDREAALRRLRELDPACGAHPTVEIAWALMALTVAPSSSADEVLASRIAQRLLDSFDAASGVFPHWPRDMRSPFLRGHVACFADLVYPVQALSSYHRATGDQAALAAAERCAAVLTRQQGLAGQWWWHFDSRTGRVLERYPVYAVHQDAMAPMALFAVQDAGGGDYRAAAAKGVQWLAHAPELGGSLIDPEADLIWRKVGRHEPGKLSRGAQAFASRVHRSLRVPGLGTVLRPGRVDYECRPYHLGWLLQAWPADKLATRTAYRGRL